MLRAESDGRLRESASASGFDPVDCPHGHEVRHRVGAFGACGPRCRDAPQSTRDHTAARMVQADNTTGHWQGAAAVPALGVGSMRASRATNGAACHVALSAAGGMAFHVQQLEKRCARTHLGRDATTTARVPRNSRVSRETQQMTRRQTAPNGRDARTLGRADDPPRAPMISTWFVADVPKPSAGQQPPRPGGCTRSDIEGHLSNR